jgi:hypothetical protein
MIMLVAISVILEVACRRFWFFALLEHRIFINFTPYESRLWHYKFWTEPAYGLLPHMVVITTALLAATTKGLSYTLTVCSIQGVSLLLFLSAAIRVSEVLSVHEWIERFCVKNTLELRATFKDARVAERAALKLAVRSGSLGAEAAAAATQARTVLSTQLAAEVQAGFADAVDVIAQLTVVDETQFVSDLNYVRCERARLREECATALKAATKGMPYAERAAAHKEKQAELEALLREKWHYRLFDEIDEATGALLPALGRMHAVPQPTKASMTAFHKLNVYTTWAVSFGFSSRSWASPAASEPDAFLDDHKRTTLRYFKVLSVCAAMLTIVVELYGFWVISRALTSPGDLLCEPQMVAACSISSCARATCTLRNGYIPAPA